MSARRPAPAPRPKPEPRRSPVAKEPVRELLAYMRIVCGRRP